MSLAYLKEVVEANDREKLIRYVRLYFGDGNEEAGKKEIYPRIDADKRGFILISL